MPLPVTRPEISESGNTPATDGTGPERSTRTPGLRTEWPSQGEMKVIPGTGIRMEGERSTLDDSRPDRNCETENSPEDRKEEVDLRPDQREFIARELARFDKVRGVSHVAEHRIIMRDSLPLKQR